MHREQPIIGFGRSQQPFGNDEIQPHQRRREAADEKEHRDAAEVKQCDALVIGGQKPAADACSRPSDRTPRSRRGHLDAFDVRRSLGLSGASDLM